jgi:hypothetical protein
VSRAKEPNLESGEDVWQFEKLEQQLHSFLAEVSELSKKKPNDALNKFKLKFINATLEALNRLLDEHRPFKDFASFDADDLPTNSDVVVILAQYATATYNFRRSQTVQVNYKWYWVVRGKPPEIETERPEHFRYEQK